MHAGLSDWGRFLTPQTGLTLDTSKWPLRVDSVEKLRARKLDVQERAFLCDLSWKIAFQATLVREKLDQNPVPGDRRSFSTQWVGSSQPEWAQSGLRKDLDQSLQPERP